MGTRHIDTTDLLTIEKDLMNIEQALNGLSMLLEDLSEKSQDQTQEISCCNSILKLVIGQTEETIDALLNMRSDK